MLCRCNKISSQLSQTLFFENHTLTTRKQKAVATWCANREQVENQKRGVDPKLRLKTNGAEHDLTVLACSLPEWKATHQSSVNWVQAHLGSILFDWVIISRPIKSNQWRTDWVSGIKAFIATSSGGLWIGQLGANRLRMGHFHLGI